MGTHEQQRARGLGVVLGSEFVADDEFLFDIVCIDQLKAVNPETADGGSPKMFQDLLAVAVALALEVFTGVHSTIAGVTFFDLALQGAVGQELDVSGAINLVELG